MAEQHRASFTPATAQPRSTPAPFRPSTGATQLPEATKKKIYWEGFDTEHRAVAEAKANYPLPEQFKVRAEYEAKRITEYDAQLMKKYGITRNQYDAIVQEGWTRKWPKP